MKRGLTAFLCLAAALLVPVRASLTAQEHDDECPEPLMRHHLTFFTGFTWVPQGETEKSDVLIVPTIGIDYTYWISHRVGIGIINDFELASYVVEQSDGTPLERKFAYVGAAVLRYEVASGFGLFGGPGVELEEDHNFFVIKVGAEYVFSMTDKWHTALAGSYDFKTEYDSWGFGVAVSRVF